MTANVITYRGRSAAREVGKALSLEPSQVDRLAKVMNHFEWVDPKETLERNLREVGLDFHDPTIQLFGRLWQQIQDLPRHLGQHSGGMVMCHGRLDDIVPLENASMPDRVVVQWDKDDCADMGLVKVDLLGLGMMAVLQDALCLVNTQRGRRARGSGLGTRRHRGSGSGSGIDGIADRDQSRTGRLGIPDRRAPSAGSEPRVADPEPDPDPDPGPDPGPDLLDLAHLPPDDPAVYAMLQEADTDRDLPGRVARADGDAAAAPAAALLRHRGRSRDHPAGPDRRADGASVSEAAAGARAGGVSASVARADSGADARRAALPGAAAADGDGGGRVHRRRGGGAAARVRVQAIREAHAADRDQAARRHGAAGDHRRRGGGDHPLDHVVRALRISGIARRQLRAARLRERLPEGALSGGVLHRDAEQPADGVLSSGHAGEGCAAARRPLRARSTCRCPTGSAASSRTGASGSG